MRFDFRDFLINASTYKPFKLDFTYESILQVFAENESSSVYQVFKRLTDIRPGLIRSGLDYKNVHVRIKRLVELKQIEQLEKHFERGAIHYKITTYGLISYLGQITKSINFDIVKIHKDNSLIKDLVYQFFEDETINSLYYVNHLNITPASLFSDYIRDCCRATFDVCSWSYFEDQNLNTILPSDKTIQDYMSYLIGRKITNRQNIPTEFQEYESKLEAKVDDPDLMYLLEAIGLYSKRYSGGEYLGSQYKKPQTINELEIKAPFPIFDLFKFIFQDLDEILSMKVKTLVSQIILNVGDICDVEAWIDTKTGRLQLDDDNEGPLLSEYDIPDMNTGGFSDIIVPILKDKKFKTIVDSIQGQYGIGIEIFNKGKPIGIRKLT